MADTPRHEETQAGGREEAHGSSGQGRAGKVAAGDRALQWTKKPGFNRKWARLLVFGFAAIAFLAVALSLERHPSAAREQKKRSAAYRSEVPSTLEVGPADYAGWQTRAAAEGAAPVQTGYGGTGIVAHAAPTVTYGAGNYGTYREVGPGASVQFANPNQPSAVENPPPPSSYQAQGSQGGMPVSFSPAQLERQRELLALRSPLFFNVSVTPPGEDVNRQAQSGRASGVPATPNDSKYVKQNMAKEKQEFLSAQKGDYGAYLDNRYITPVDASHELIAGTIIPITMVTGINSDLPGTILAQVNENVYDTITGENILIPGGSRLLGEYDNSIAFGQNRVLCAWNRLIEPDGVSIELRGMPGTDLEGKSGFQDKVDYHFTKLLEGVGLATVFDIATNAALSALSTASFLQSIASSMVVSGSASSTAGSETQQIVLQYATKLLDQQPTIVIRAGYRANVIVNKDMILPAYPDTTITYSSSFP